MRRWIPWFVDDLLLPVLLAWILALAGSLPFREGVVFFPLAEIAATLLRRHLPIAPAAARILGPLAAPLPVLLVVWTAFPDAELLEVGEMAVHWLIYLGYAALMAFLLPAIEAFLGLPERYPDDDDDD